MVSFRRLFEIDFRALAIFRVGLGLVAFSDMFLRLFDYSTFYSESGILPRWAALKFDSGLIWKISAYHMSGGEPLQIALILLTFASIIALIIGYKTRVATVLVWFLMMSIQNRNFLVLNAGDGVLRALLFWSMFLPLGHKWSVDAKNFANSVKSYVSVSTAAIFLQIFIIYIFTAILKDGENWANGQAINFALANGMLHTAFGEWIGQFHAMNRFMTHFTLWFEIVAPVALFLPLFFVPLRVFLVFTFIGFHMGLFVTLNISFFPIINIVSFIPFLPTEFWDYLDKKINLSHRITNILNQFQFTGSQLKTFRLNNFQQIFVIFSFVIISMWNLNSLDFNMPTKSWKWYAYTFRLNQRWNMFAPQPPRSEAWFVIYGELSDGRKVNLYHPESKIDFSPPESIRETFHNGRWRKYLSQIRKKRYKWARTFLGRYYCQKYQSEFDSKLERVQIYKVTRKINPDLTKGEPKERHLWKKTCT